LTLCPTIYPKHKQIQHLYSNPDSNQEICEEPSNFTSLNINSFSKLIGQQIVILNGSISLLQILAETSNINLLSLI
jgi:hypothetical protein